MDENASAFVESDCGETTFSAGVESAVTVNNMYLVVDDGDSVQNALIPIDGTSASITVGPFFTQSGENRTISWRVWGGGERTHDDPHWTGFGGATFSADINEYGRENGFGFVTAGKDDPNPFTTWHDITVSTCAITREACMNGGWQQFGFANQGQCIRFANTGQR